MKHSMCTILLFFIAIISPVFAQKTGHVDSFDGPVRVTTHPYFGFHQANGILQVDVRVPQGAKWQGFTYMIGDTLDLSDNGKMNLRMKSDFDFLLTVYLIDAAGLYKTADQKIQRSDTFVDYYIPFQMTAGFDSRHITQLRFTPNGNAPDAVNGTIYLDELRVGSDAIPMAGIGGTTKKQFFIGSSQNQIRLVDLENVAGFELVSGSAAATNVKFSEISHGSATLTFDCAPQFIGHDTLHLKAVGSSGFADNFLQIPLFIEDNLPPTIDAIADLSVQVGDTISIRLTGITDGNGTIEQPLTLSASSTHQLALPDSNLLLRYQPGATVAELILIPMAASSDVQVTIGVNDGFAYNNLTTTTFRVDVFQEFNHPPTMDEIPNQFVYLAHGQQTLLLSGISDGDNGTQTLTFEIASSDTTVVKNQNLQLEYSPGATTATLLYTPSAFGRTLITVNLTDDGGTANNNGHASLMRSFFIEVAPLPQSGIAVPLERFGAGNVTNLVNPGDWNVESYGMVQKPVLGTFHGKENVLKITLNNKTCWTGIWYIFEELDLSQHRYMCYDIYFEGGSFANGGKTHSYVWDVNDNRNLPRAHDQRKTVPAGQWRTVFMDYRGAGGMNTDAGQEINVKRINRILINYATDFVWPFPVNSGMVYLANIRVGDAVPDSLIPKVKPVCTIDPVPAQTVMANAGPQQIQLTGIGNGVVIGSAGSVTATSNNPNFIPSPTVSALQADGTAILTYQPAASAGNAIITVTVKAEGSADYSIQFRIYVVDSGGEIVAIAVDPSRRFQTIRGFGTFEFSERQNYIDHYTTDLGASAVRIGIIGNQIEPVNDNNDPYTLDMTALNDNAFDFNYFRQLKSRGVETFILTSWSPPAWMKRNLSLGYGYAEAPNYDATDNILEPYYYDEFAESMIAVVRMFRDRAGIDLYAIGPQNEPAFNEPYPSAVLSPIKYAELVAVIGPRLRQEGLQTKIFMPEQVFSQAHYSMAQYILSLRLNPLADQHTDIIATHGYAADGVGEQNPTYEGWSELWNNSQTCAYTKELWMTETFPEYRNWQSAFSLAGAIHGALAYGNVSLWTLWSIEGTLMEKGKPTASFYTSKNYYKFIRPGAQRIAVEENHNDLLASAFIDAKHHRLTAVLINKGAAPLKVYVQGDSIPLFYGRYVTTEFINFQYDGSCSHGQTIILPPKSVTTLVGSMAGGLSGVVEQNNPPQSWQLLQNYPNPFNPTTNIEFSLEKPGTISLEVYNVLGQKVRTLAEGFYPAGRHLLVWDGRDDRGQMLTTGVYFYRFKIEKSIITKKCILLR